LGVSTWSANNHGLSVNRNKSLILQGIKLSDMQFLLLAYDGTDSEGLRRRMNVREDHLKKISGLKKAEEFLFGGAILDESGKMIGSMIVYDFPDRQALDERLKNEPYITEGVWEKIEIQPFRLAKIE
jgi:uncharacterized protein